MVLVNASTIAFFVLSDNCGTVVGSLAGRQTTISLPISALLAAAYRKQATVPVVVSVAAAVATTERPGRQGTASVTAATDITVISHKYTQGAAVIYLTQPTAVTASAAKGAQSGQDLSLTSGVTTSGQAGRQDSVVLSLSGTISTTVLKDGQVSVTIPLTVSTAAQGSTGRSGAADVSVASALTAVGLQGVPGHIEERMVADGTWELELTVTATFEGSIVTSAICEYEMAG